MEGGRSSTNTRGQRMWEFPKEEKGRRGKEFQQKVNPEIAAEAPLSPSELVQLPRHHINPNGSIRASGSHIWKGRWS